MLSPTLQQGLKGYAIGPKIRALRVARKIGLAELGRHTGLSPAMLSRIERGRLFPTLPTLLRIALVFNVGLEFFFAGVREKPVVGVVRRAARLRFPDKPGAKDVAYRFESLDYSAAERRLHAYYAEFLPTAPQTPRPHRHAGGEFIYLLTGTLHVRIGEEEQVLGRGDSLYFDSAVLHSYKRGGRGACRAIVVVTP